MTISYLKYSLVNGFIHQWLTAGPLSTDILDLSPYPMGGVEAGIYQQFATPDLEVTLPPVDLGILGPISEGKPSLYWRYYRCLDDHLVDVLLDDLGSEPGALPLLSHALLETWKRRRGRVMTVSGYTASGGVHGAIAQTAETVFRQRLTPEQQPIARMIFIKLAEIGEGAVDTRRRATFQELITRATDLVTIDAVLGILTDARLITTDTLELSDPVGLALPRASRVREAT